MPDIVSIRLMGGLGNQLFQLFTVIAYGIEYTKTVVLPYVPELHVGTVRSTYWDTFLIGLRELTTYNTNSNETNSSLLQMPLYKEKHFHYTEIPQLKDTRTLLFGYYQSYKYFDKYNDTIQNMIGLHKQQSVIRETYSDLFLDKETISMHFRLGDYKDIQESHPLLTLNYYYNAICSIATNQDKSYRILYFCQKNDNVDVLRIILCLSSRFPSIEFVKVDDSIDDWKQLLVMSVCSHNIIANSTYSWWAAWFNMNENKIVCYPNVWFGPDITHDTSDLFPSNWTKIYW